MKVQVTVDTEVGDERALIRALTLALARRVGWDATAAALMLGRDRTTITRRLKKWGINATTERAKVRERKLKQRVSSIAPSAGLGVSP